VIADLPPPQTTRLSLSEGGTDKARSRAASTFNFKNIRKYCKVFAFNIWGFNTSTEPDLWDLFLELNRKRDL